MSLTEPVAVFLSAVITGAAALAAVLLSAWLRRKTEPTRKRRDRNEWERWSDRLQVELQRVNDLQHTADQSRIDEQAKQIKGLLDALARARKESSDGR